ncbi:MAG: DUF4393 domain-containing protein [Oscillospiraceae bacterium]|nr:DUF4393 domain-containing protein [Oscillospiraceae bacterium]
MNESDLAADIAIAATTEGIKQVGQVVPAFYDDGLKPAVKQIGEFLEILFGVPKTLILPIKFFEEWAANKLKDLFGRTKPEVDKIPPGRRKKVQLEDILPILDAYMKTKAEDEDLQNMFAKLLASYADSEAQTNSRRAFMKIIEELSAYDAWMLRQIYENKFKYAIRHSEEQLHGYELASYVPCGIVQLNSTEAILEEIKAIGGKTSRLSLACQSMENLIRLKLITLVLDDSDKRHIEFIMSCGIMPYAEGEDAFFNFIKTNRYDKSTLFNVYDINAIRISLFGKDFCSVCIKSSIQAKPIYALPPPKESPASGD